MLHTVGSRAKVSLGKKNVQQIQQKMHERSDKLVNDVATFLDVPKCQVNISDENIESRAV